MVPADPMVGLPPLTSIPIRGWNARVPSTAAEQTRSASPGVAGHSAVWATAGEATATREPAGDEVSGAHRILRYGRAKRTVRLPR